MGKRKSGADNGDTIYISCFQLESKCIYNIVSAAQFGLVF